MNYWEEPILKTSYRYVQIDRSTGNEVGLLPMLKGGTITRNDDTTIKETAQVECVGKFSIGADLVRIYMTAEWMDGHTEDVCLGTFLPVAPTRSVKPGYSTSTVKMYGRLQELADDGFAYPVSIEPGTNAVAAAKGVIEGNGLTVYADDSDFVTTEARSYGIGVVSNAEDNSDTSKMGMINSLLDLANFRAAKTNVYGNVILEKYVSLENQGITWEFREGASAKFEGELSEERDTTSTANHVVVRYGTTEESITGEAWDTDPASEFSTVSRERTITKAYEYNELPSGKTTEEKTAYANKRAATLLKTAQAVIHRVTITHAYAPININEAVTFDYPSGDISGKFEVRTMTLSLTGGCPTTTELRRYNR